MNGAQVNTVFEWILHRDGRPTGPVEDADSRPLEVNVVFTSPAATARAVERAVELARGLNARLRLLVAQVVSYAVPLETPPVLGEFQEALFRDMARGYGVETRVDIFVCRDAEQALLRNLPPRSLVVLGARKRWWPTPAERLAHRPPPPRHAVIFVSGD